MTQTRKVKFLISLAILIIVALFAVTIVQIVKINTAKNQIAKQQEQIQQLEKQLNSYEKTPNGDFETIS